MDTEQIIWFVVVVVVVLAIAAALMALIRRRRHSRTEADRAHAGQLREEAVSSTDGLGSSRAEAQRARAEAEAADARATEAEQRVEMTEARVEDRVREADRVDPDVDQRSDDYRPEVPEPDGATATTEDPERPAGDRAPRADEGGSHRA